MEKNISQKHFLRSRSTSKSNKQEPKSNPLTSSTSVSNPKTQTRKPQENEYYSTKFRSRTQTRLEVPTRRARSASASPSAWALSPGRSQPQLPEIVVKARVGSASKRDHSSSKGSNSGGGIFGFLKRKKISSAEKQDFHQLCVLQNRLLQWRFVNARGDVSTTYATRAAQKSMINAFVRVSRARNSVAEKRNQLVQSKLVIKARSIVFGQLCMLNEWTRLERKNCEAVGRLGRKLSAISISLPLIRDAKADEESLVNEMSIARKIMDGTTIVIADFQSQAEEICYLLTELSVVQEEMKESVMKLENDLALVLSLLVSFFYLQASLFTDEICYSNFVFLSMQRRAV